jgi:hypothetical protein
MAGRRFRIVRLFVFAPDTGDLESADAVSTFGASPVGYCLRSFASPRVPGDAATTSYMTTALT